MNVINEYNSHNRRYKNKLVSVLIPVYNNAQFAKKAIDSILNQSYPNIEIVIVDSSDDVETVNILCDYGDKINRYIQPRNGISAALNYGLAHCKGEYIARMDADDISLESRIEKQVNFMECHPDVDVLGSEIKIIDENDNVIGISNSGVTSDSQIKANLIFDNCINHPTVMFRSSLFHEGWKYELPWFAEDIDLWMRMAFKGKKFANLPEQLVLYRRYNNTLMASKNIQEIINIEAKSASSYVCGLFQIDKMKYDLENFTISSFWTLVKSNYKKIVIDQFLLLDEIYNQNCKLQRIPQVNLIRVLNGRWNLINRRFVSDYGKQFMVAEEDTRLFTLQLQEKLCLDSVDKVFNKLKLSLDEEELIRKQIFAEMKKVIIYGIGDMGKLALKALKKKQELGEIKWKLLAVADSQKKTYESEGKLHHTISPLEIKDYNPDLILISSDKYFDEISSDLICRGIDENMILRCGCIFS